MSYAKELINIVENADRYESDSINIKIQRIADKYGYISGSACITNWNSIKIPLRAKNVNSFYPKIIYNEDTREFEIHTVSYGDLNLRDCEEFVNCYKDALDMIKEITQLDLSKLPRE